MRRAHCREVRPSLGERSIRIPNNASSHGGMEPDALSFVTTRTPATAKGCYLGSVQASVNADPMASEGASIDKVNDMLA